MRFQFSALNGKLLNSFLRIPILLLFSLALHSFLLCVCECVCGGVCGGVCISTFVRFPHSHFAFRIQCYSFNGIVKAELGWDAAGNFPNTRYLKDSHTHKWCCKARQCPSASPRPKSLPETKVLSELREKLVTFSLPRYLPHSNGERGEEKKGGGGKRSLSQGFCT